ncbi:MAG: hypothetical protein HUU15_04020 [Candidatus Brocadiae bacterium]|nr:hypothetical protein [Candidatus Brocadiia bacterium]
MGTRKRPAYTLVEILLGVVVGAGVMMGVLSIMRGGLRMFSQTQEAQDSLQSATMLTEIIGRDLRYMAFPMVKAPAAQSGITSQAAPPSGGTSGATPVPGPVPPAGAGPGGDTLLPYSAWDAGAYQPQVQAGDVWDLGKEDKAFRFYRTEVAAGDGGLFGIGAANEAGYLVKLIEYKGIPSPRYPGSFLLQRTEFDTSTDNDGNPVSSGGAGKSTLFKPFYFRRLVISLHAAPDQGAKTGDASPPPPPPAAGGTAALQDTLFFARIMVAGVAVGSGSRQVRGADEAAGSKGKEAMAQKVDLLVSVIHLDAVTDRFRARSRARNWNAELPRPTTTP